MFKLNIKLVRAIWIDGTNGEYTDKIMSLLCCAGLEWPLVLFVHFIQLFSSAKGRADAGSRDQTPGHCSPAWTPLVLGYWAGSLSGSENLRNSDLCLCHARDHPLPHASLWEPAFRVSLEPPHLCSWGEKLLVCYLFSCTLDRLKSSEMYYISFIQGPNLPTLTGPALCMRFFPVCVLLTSWSALTITLELGWHSSKLWPTAWCFKSPLRSWQLFFMTSIRTICKVTRHREREGPYAVRRCQGLCLFALIVAMDILGH